MVFSVAFGGGGSGGVGVATVVFVGNVGAVSVVFIGNVGGASVVFSARCLGSGCSFFGVLQRRSGCCLAGLVAGSGWRGHLSAEGAGLDLRLAFFPVTACWFRKRFLKGFSPYMGAVAILVI